MATVARTYRKAIDDYKTSPGLYRSNMDYYREEISKCTYRQFTTGFYFGKTTEESQIYDSNTYIREYTYLGMVEQTDTQGRIVLEQRNKFAVGETIEAMLFDGRNQELSYRKSGMMRGILWNRHRIRSSAFMWIWACSFRSAAYYGGRKLSLPPVFGVAFQEHVFLYG